MFSDDWFKLKGHKGEQTNYGRRIFPLSFHLLLNQVTSCVKSCVMIWHRARRSIERGSCENLKFVQTEVLKTRSRHFASALACTILEEHCHKYSLIKLSLSS